MSDKSSCGAGYLDGPKPRLPGEFDPVPAATAIRLLADTQLHHPSQATKNKLLTAFERLNEVARTEPMIAGSVLEELRQPDPTRTLPTADVKWSGSGIDYIEFHSGCLDLSNAHGQSMRLSLE